MGKRIVTALVLAWSLSAAREVLAAGREAPLAQRAADMVALSTGERLLGMFAGPPGDGPVRFLVCRAWLTKNEPEYYRQITAGEVDRARQALEQLRSRVLDWQQRRPEPANLAAFLESALEQTEKQLKVLNAQPAAEIDRSQLLVIEIPAANIKRHYAQRQAARRILGLAWEHQLDDAEQKSSAALVRWLDAKGVKLEAAEPDLSDRLGILLQDDRQWAAKVALVEYQLLGVPHFHGTGKLLVREDSQHQRPALAELIANLLAEQLESGLADLLAPRGAAARPAGGNQLQRAAESALRTAEAEGLRAARITYLRQDIARGQVTVIGRFLAQMPDGSWQTVWEHEVSADRARPRPDAEKRIAHDPQVAEAMELVKQLGLEPDPAMLQLAVRHGAAVMEAQDAVERVFARFLLQSTRRLDGPPVWFTTRTADEPP